VSKYVEIQKFSECKIEVTSHLLSSDYGFMLTQERRSLNGNELKGVDCPVNMGQSWPKI